MGLKIPFGLKNGRAYTPLEVQNGLACGCHCPGCHAPLIAKHPKVKVPHFAHHNVDACPGGYESSLHLAAKQAIADSMQIYVPSISETIFLSDRDTDTRANAKRLIEGRVIDLDEVEQEVREFAGVVPDIVAKRNGKLLFIEIAVTHLVDEEKLKKLSALNVPVLEIKLDPQSELPSMEEIRELVVTNPKNRTWLLNPKKKQLRDELTVIAKQKLDIEIKKVRVERQRDETRKRKYLAMPDAQKFERELSLSELLASEVAPLINHPVKGELSFQVSNSVWQLVVYRRFVHRRIGDMLLSENIAKWLAFKFDVKPYFAESEVVAVHNYLLRLSILGLLKQGMDRSFCVMKDIFTVGRLN